MNSLSRRSFKKKKELSLTKSSLKKNKYSSYEIGLFIYLQQFWKKYFKFIILKKIIILQKNVKGWFTRKVLLEIRVINNKVEKFIRLIKCFVLLNSFRIKKKKKKIIKFEKPILAKKFLNLQKYIRHFLLYQKIMFIISKNDLNGLYLIPDKLLKISKKNNNVNPFFIKKNRPISKILILQKNIRYFYFTNRPKPRINKIFMIHNYYFTKIIKQYKLGKTNRPHSIEGLIPIKKPKNQSNFTKKIINLLPLLYIQKKYKKRYKYLVIKKFYKKSKKIDKSSRYDCSFTKIFKIDKMKYFLLVQYHIKYFLYRINSAPNIITKQYLNRMVFTKETIVKSINKGLNKNKQIIIFLLNKIFKTHFNLWLIKKLKGEEIPKDLKKIDYKYKYDDLSFKVINEEGDNDNNNFNSNLNSLINSISKRQSKEGGSIKSQKSLRISPKKFSLTRNLQDSNKRSFKNSDSLSNMSILTLSKGEDGVSSPRKRSQNSIKRKSKYSSNSNSGK